MAAELGSEQGRLANKVAIVVGAGQTPGQTIGNGRAISMLYAREGARVFLVDRDRESLEATAVMVREGGGHASTFVGDATNEATCEQLAHVCVRQFDRIDVLTNVVGTGAGDRSALRITEEDWDTMMQVNMKSVLFTCKYVLPNMRTAQSGSIINISSSAAAASAGYVGYKVSKAGVNALTHSIAMSNAKYGIRANAIMPGLMDTPMAIEGITAVRDISREELRAERDALVPLRKRMGTAWDTAYAALFLASEEAQFITGVTLPVDGGQVARIG